ncbi:MAG TPA: polysaccharide deacetylase family protein, partial [Acidimicrobiia bacterium]
TDAMLPPPPGPRILIYHQVEAGLGRYMEVRLEDFRCQLEWLFANRQVVGLDEALVRWGQAGSEIFVALTFDDGYRDTYSTAYPILLDRGFPFTLYLATESIESGVSLGPTERADPLTWDQVGTMHESGLLTSGAHTHRHADVRQLSAQEVEEELGLSDDLIEQRLGVRPAHFAYPWGFWSPTADGPVRERYSSAAVAGSGRAKRELQPHRLARYPVQLSDGFRFFRGRLRGGLRLEEVIRRRVNAYTGP